MAANGKSGTSHPIRTRVKSAIARVMPHGPRWDVICNLPKIEEWRKKHVAKDCPTFEQRTELYEHLNQNVLGGGAIDYLEFGVFQGESIRYWSSMNRDSASRFYGFDTFTGLPETWQKFTGHMAKDTFDCGGSVPQIDDGRVQFVKGLFQDTLDNFLSSLERRSPLVLHNDSDLYSATLYVLTRCHDMLVPGSIVVFDEFSSVLNEFKALGDYCSAYRREYEVLGVTASYFAQVAIRLL
jgi:O-methyltransferase